MELDPAIRAALGTLPDRPVHALDKRQMAHFRRVIGWEDGPVVPYPTDAERAVRRKREAWKRRRAGKCRPELCLLYRQEQIDRLKKNLETDRHTARWFHKLIAIADRVSALPAEIFNRLIEDLGPWNCSGVYCPNCVGKKSPQSLHNRFWKWTVSDMDRIACPYCGIAYPHPDFPEEGLIDLPRLGLQYRFYLSPQERALTDWRLGETALRYAGFPVHVSLSGEIRSAKLDWALGQVEPLCIAYALTGRKRHARAAEAILLRLAEVYPRYPLNSYNHDYVDAEPGYAAENVEQLPTLFKKNAFLPAYTGILRKDRDLFGQARTTPFFTRVASGAWGCTRLAREKSATGQLFLSLLRGYDLVKSAISPENRLRIERDFLLEQYLDVRALSRKIDNKTGPGATARVAVGLLYDDEREVAEGLDYFHRTIKSQYHPDGSPREAPVYAAKPVYENLWEIPELLRGRVDLYAEGAYANGLRMFADIATPLGTQPPIDDSPATYRLPPTIVDVARLRTGVGMSYGPRDFAAFNLTDPKPKIGASFYVPTLAQLPGKTTRGFHPVGFLTLPYEKRSAFSMFNEPLPAPRKRALKKATNRYYHDRGLACLGYGSGRAAVQLYLIAEDGRTAHRHCAPLSILLFACGREVLPDLGYIADHPANLWIKSTPAHNTVTVDGRNLRATGPGKLNAFVPDGPVRFIDAAAPVEGLERYRRAVALLRKSDGLPALVDIFDVTGGRIHDYQMRVNDPGRKLALSGLALRGRRAGLYAEHASDPPRGFRTAGRAAAPFTATWGKTLKVRAEVLTPCDEVITYHTPAWRDCREVFAAPEKAFDTLVLRRRRKGSRFLVVYELFREKPLLKTTGVTDIKPGVALRIQERNGRAYNLKIGQGEIDHRP